MFYIALNFYESITICATVLLDTCDIVRYTCVRYTWEIHCNKKLSS